MGVYVARVRLCCVYVINYNTADDTMCIRFFFLFYIILIMTTNVARYSFGNRCTADVL